MERGIATSTKPENSSAENTENTEPTDKTGQPPSHFVVWLWIQARRIVIFVIGSTVVLIGIAMIVLPGPAFIVIPLGLAILATEFLWAKKWLAYAQDHLKNLATQIAKTSTLSPQPPAAKQSRRGTAPGYPRRQPVEEADADWSRPLPGYAPPEFTSPKVFQNAGVWADPADITQVTRKLLTRTPSGDLPVSLDPHGFPLNPLGRTGLRGRGLLGKWGRNQAGDPLVTRFDPSTGQLQVLVIERSDSGRLALPGGMVDEGEAITTTVSRELAEETGAHIRFEETQILFAGVVDDPRNTDHAWMETTVLHQHLTADQSQALALQAGDDAKSVHWMEINPTNLAALYASHADFVRLAVRKLQGHPQLKQTVPELIGVKLVSSRTERD
jgi:ADP-ribose pyrophosphatase